MATFALLYVPRYCFNFSDVCLCCSPEVTFQSFAKLDLKLNFHYYHLVNHNQTFKK